MTIIGVNANKTLGVGDDGILQDMLSASTVTIPNDSTWDFQIEDTIQIFNDSSGTITIACESPVVMRAKGSTISTRYGMATIEKKGANEWIAWGDLV